MMIFETAIAKLRKPGYLLQEYLFEIIEDLDVTNFSLILIIILG